MSTQEDHRALDRHAAQLLLGGDPAVRRTHRRLGDLLAAATTPASARDLAGENAAVAAFTAARLAPPHRPRRIEMLKSTLAKLLTVKVAATVIALGGAGGVALAASTGALPGPLHKPAPHSSADASHSARPHPSGAPLGRPGFPPPPADLFELCRQYSATPGDDRGHALDEPQFGNLVQQAGGGKDRDRVDHFCADLRKPRPSGSPSFSKPPVRPSARPGAGDTDAGPRPGEEQQPSRAAR